jgi:hypothetical protein
LDGFSQSHIIGQAAAEAEFAEEMHPAQAVPRSSNQSIPELTSILKDCAVRKIFPLASTRHPSPVNRRTTRGRIGALKIQINPF